MKLCECGCGQVAPISNRNHKRYGWVKNQPKRFISGHNSKGCNNPRWNGGNIAFGKNYRLQFAPGHPRSHQNHVLEHILIAEKALGKPLPLKSVIHHHTPEQLVVCQNQAYHVLLHRRTRALKTCGHAGWLKCRYCHQYDEPGNLHIMPSGAAYHTDCQKLNYQKLKRS